jgi:hypothetical protein
MNDTVAKLSAILHCLNFKDFFPYSKQRGEECLTQYHLQIKNFFSVLFLLNILQPQPREMDVLRICSTLINSVSFVCSRYIQAQ